ncbi:conjugative transposon protein TraM [Flavobacterium qiangtangense]|uniref:Conjugative transposon protein TraM n=1 Tax=Flavobacterium qiangtangense TaxID=1442595 RepID=A0ABW1PII7_9FLAO
MKENEKKASVLVKEAGTSGAHPLPDAEKSGMERLKKPAIFVLMGSVFLGCLYLIFNPAPDPEAIENIGLNGAVPQASEAGMQADKQKAYEQEMLEQKNQEKRSALTTLSDYWNESSSSSKKQDTLAGQKDQSMGHDNNPESSDHPALSSYRSSQSALGSFYKDDNNETRELRRQLDELQEKLAANDVPKSATVDDQLALMEKSYQMAAKYLPNGTHTNGAATEKSGTAASKQNDYFAAFAPAEKNAVSALYREPSDSAFLADWSADRNRNFYTSGYGRQTAQPKNSVKACIQETQTLIGETGVRLRLLEPAQTPGRTIPQGTLLTAIAKFQSGRLQLKVTSLELDGNIIPVDIIIYDLDGQQGLHVPYSPEINALAEMAGNMSQTSGTSLMLTQSAGQQAAADLSRGVVQGISGYFSKKVKTPKVTLKAGHQVFLVSKKQ